MLLLSCALPCLHAHRTSRTAVHEYSTEGRVELYAGRVLMCSALGSFSERVEEKNLVKGLRYCEQKHKKQFYVVSTDPASRNLVFDESGA